ncbi:MAG TPA: hypothetical protein PL182_05245 [Pseudobdellovibrionaceae bacterium]|nr:hypothetical protein [Pseudobdellovibrionaceae bacterium]
MPSQFKSLPIVLTLVLLFSSAWSEAQNCERKIIFLPQTHAPDEMASPAPDPDLDLEIASSQLKVAQYLEKFPKTPVFSEQAAGNDFSMKLVPKETVKALRQLFAEQIFPHGLPGSPSRMTKIQRQKLIDNGGDFVQLIRGRADIIHKVVGNQDELNEIFDPIQKWFKQNRPGTPYPPKIGALVYGARERAALVQINEHFALNPESKKVILIYGQNHSFKFYEDLFPSECIHIPPDFQADLRGRFRTGPEGFSIQALSIENGAEEFDEGIR